MILLPIILILACASSSPAFLMMYSTYKLNKQGNNIQPWCTAFPIWNQSVISCPVWTVASWPAYRFLKRQVKWSRIPISLRIFHSCDPLRQRLWHSQQSRSRCFPRTLLLFPSSVAINKGLGVLPLTPPPSLQAGCGAQLILRRVPDLTYKRPSFLYWVSSNWSCTVSGRSDWLFPTTVFPFFLQ